MWGGDGIESAGHDAGGRPMFTIKLDRLLFDPVNVVGYNSHVVDIEMHDGGTALRITVFDEDLVKEALRMVVETLQEHKYIRTARSWDDMYILP